VATHKLLSTTNYDLFVMSDDNRPPDLEKHGKLVESMRRYGYLRDFPVVVRRDEESGKFVVKDGQHRLATARSLGLPVWYSVSEIDFDVPFVTTTVKQWTLLDHARVWADKGNKSCIEAIAFSEAFGLPLGSAFMLLSGQSSLSKAANRVKEGTFTVKDKDRAAAERVARVYTACARFDQKVKNARFLAACMAVCRVPGFDEDRMVRHSQRCPELLLPFNTVEACLGMLERVYNHKVHARNAVPLKHEAEKLLKERWAPGRPASQSD
jgi:hypothetical protein